MTPVGVIAILGLVVGGIALAGRALQTGTSPSPRVRAELLRARAIEAQQRAAGAARDAREWVERWEIAQARAARELRNKETA